MSKADQLGAGRFGGGVRPISARRQAVAAATGVPTHGVAPPTELSPRHISLNPDNPRSSLGDLTDLAGSLKTHGQKQAITVMNRDVYIEANPDREADLEPDTAYVVIDGSSRLAAAREARLPLVKVLVSDDQGSNPEELLESALIANIHRQDLPELDEARALQRLLAIYGSQTALAKRLHRSQGWVSQRLALLNLTPELQATIGQEPIDLLRAIANKPATDQQAALQQLKEDRAQKEELKRDRANARRKGAPAAESSGQTDNHYGVMEDGTPRGSREDDGRAKSAGQPRADGLGTYYDVIGNGDPGADEEPDGKLSRKQAVPEPRFGSPADDSSGHDSETDRGARKVPYDEPGSLAMLLDAKIESDDVFFSLLQFLNAKALERDATRLKELADSFAERATARVE
ncbi:ParB/RepB/Spo0J family partition protein [Streptomyces sp. NPDC048362]|uniref:ParB/RepB/Spo0J family partition protein n=1 Tax=Streptomyces sp. NPDC048362 TaxID=3365539 RepID=UPI003716F796